jgi:hypothetical protein
LQNNWVRASPSTAVLMGLSLRYCSPLNGVAKVDVRQAVTAVPPLSSR